MTPSFSKRVTATLPIFIGLAVVFLVSGCQSGNESWNGKNIRGLMPELQFSLVDTNGVPVASNDYHGRIRMLSFGFTSCPDVCPTTLRKLDQATAGLPPERRDEVLTLFISVDPRRDTPERLANYVEFFGDQIVGLTGSESQLRELAKRYRTTFGYEEPDANGNYAVSHSSAVYVFDRQGRARLLVRPELSAAEIRQDLVALLEEG